MAKQVDKLLHDFLVPTKVVDQVVKDLPRVLRHRDVTAVYSALGDLGHFLGGFGQLLVAIDGSLEDRRPAGSNMSARSVLFMLSTQVRGKTYFGTVDGLSSE